MNNYWTTANGKKIKYRNLPDAHLKNIIKDGYRNPHIICEAEKRKFKIPERPIDRMSFMELWQREALFLEACASCAIEGNAYGDLVTKLYRNNKPAFYLVFNDHLARHES